MLESEAILKIINFSYKISENSNGFLTILTIKL